MKLVTDDVIKYSMSTMEEDFLYIGLAGILLLEK